MADCLSPRVDMSSGARRPLTIDTKHGVRHHPDEMHQSHIDRINGPEPCGPALRPEISPEPDEGG